MNQFLLRHTRLILRIPTMHRMEASAAELTAVGLRPIPSSALCSAASHTAVGGAYEGMQPFVGSVRHPESTEPQNTHCNQIITNLFAAPNSQTE